MILIGTVSLAAGGAAAQVALGPAELLEQRLQTRMLTQTTGTITGEEACWHAAWRADDFVGGARQTGDLEYLRAGITYFDALLAKLHTSPDGYRGWVGPYMYDESVNTDVHVGDAVVVNPMLGLVEYVRTEVAAEYRERFVVGVQRYVELAEHLCAKWEARGTWREEGHYGGYISWDRFLLPDHMDSLVTRPDTQNAGLSLPFNKQQAMGIMHLRLYRLTGDPEHRRKAEFIFRFAKSRLSLFDDHYTWNYWEPFNQGDVLSVVPAELGHWVGTHPYRDYQDGEVSEFVEAYHSGIVFAPEDIRRLVRTNLRMWNGDPVNPQWANSDLAANRAAVPDFAPPKPEPGLSPKLAGTLWRALAEFDSTLAALAGGTATNTGLVRRYPLPVTVFEWPVPRVTYLNLGCVLPAALARGETAYLVSKARAAGQLRILLTDAAVGAVLQELYDGATPGGLDGLEGLLVRAWVADPEPGQYRIRWVYGDEHRDYPVTVR